jgi:hypothetical protein
MNILTFTGVVSNITEQNQEYYLVAIDVTEHSWEIYSTDSILKYAVVKSFKAMPLNRRVIVQIEEFSIKENKIYGEVINHAVTGEGDPFVSATGLGTIIKKYPTDKRTIYNIATKSKYKEPDGKYYDTIWIKPSLINNKLSPYLKEKTTVVVVYYPTFSSYKDEIVINGFINKIGFADTKKSSDSSNSPKSSFDELLGDIKIDL